MFGFLATVSSRSGPVLDRSRSTFSAGCLQRRGKRYSCAPRRSCSPPPQKAALPTGRRRVFAKVDCWDSSLLLAHDPAPPWTAPAQPSLPAAYNAAGRGTPVLAPVNSSLLLIVGTPRTPAHTRPTSPPLSTYLVWTLHAPVPPISSSEELTGASPGVPLPAAL